MNCRKVLWHSFLHLIFQCRYTTYLWRYVRRTCMMGLIYLLYFRDIYLSNWVSRYVILFIFISKWSSSRGLDKEIIIENRISNFLSFFFPTKQRMWIFSLDFGKYGLSFHLNPCKVHKCLFLLEQNEILKAWMNWISQVQCSEGYSDVLVYYTF